MKKQLITEAEKQRMQKLAGIINEEQTIQPIPEEIEEYIISLFDMSISDEEEDGEPFKEIFDKEGFGDEDGFEPTYNFIKSQGGSITIEGNPDITAKALEDGSIELSGIHSLD